MGGGKIPPPLQLSIQYNPTKKQLNLTWIKFKIDKSSQSDSLK